MGDRVRSHAVFGSKMNLPSVSVIIPTLNAASVLEGCLESISAQDYPKELVEVIIADGGSIDRTLEIAEKYNCRILHNKKVLAEPGVNLGLEKAKNEICFILAADNEIVGRNWIRKMVKPFANPEVRAAFPKQVNSPSDNWLTRYVNVFTDPFNHFVYGNAANARTFHRVYKVIKKTKDYIVFDFTVKDHPILALAQGFAVRKGFRRPKGMEHDDMLPIIEMIKSGQKIAYVFSVHLCHHTIRNLKHFIRKNKWAIDNALSDKNYGFSSREKYLSKARKIKARLWPFYAVSFIFPLLNSLRGGIIDKEKLWFYHPIVSFIVALVAWKEFVKIKILGKGLVLRGKPS